MTRDSALIVVDVQRDFADPKGNLFVQEGDRVARKLSYFINAWHERGNLTVFTKDWHPEETTHFDAHGGPWPKHCVAGTWGAEFHPDLGAPDEVSDNMYLIYKGTDPGEDGYSGFHGEKDGAKVETGLHAILQENGIKFLTIVGIALDVCVKATALDAVELGYDAAVYREYTAAVTDKGAQEALEEMVKAGVTIL